MYGQNVGISQAIAWMRAEAMEMRRELGMFHGRLSVVETAAPAVPEVPVEAFPTPAPKPELEAEPVGVVHVPILIPDAVSPPLEREAIDLPQLKASIEAAVKTSIRTSLLSELTRGMREERQLIESALTIRYDAMVSRMVRDHMLSSMDQLRVFVDEAVALASAATERAALQKTAAAAAAAAEEAAEAAQAAVALAGSTVPSQPVPHDVSTELPQSLDEQMLPPTPTPTAGVLLTPVVKAAIKKAPRGKRHSEVANKAINMLDLGTPLVSMDASAVSADVSIPSPESFGEDADGMVTTV